MLFIVGDGLYVTDGTASGTNLIKNILGGKTIYSLTSLGNGKALFDATMKQWL